MKTTKRTIVTASAVAALLAATLTATLAAPAQASATSASFATSPLKPMAVTTTAFNGSNVIFTGSPDYPTNALPGGPNRLLEENVTIQMDGSYNLNITGTARYSDIVDNAPRTDAGPATGTLTVAFGVGNGGGAEFINIRVENGVVTGHSQFSQAFKNNGRPILLNGPRWQDG